VVCVPHASAKYESGGSEVQFLSISDGGLRDILDKTRMLHVRMRSIHAPRSSLT